jgi:hypothetical protein
MVEARIDTLSGLFMVDTGSERLVLNDAYFKPDANSRAVTAAGNTGLVSMARLQQVDSLQIEVMMIRNLYAHLVNLQHIEQKKHIRLMGILGYNVFEGFELFIDFENRRIVLSRLDRKGNRLDTSAVWETPYDSLNFDLQKHLIVVEVQVNSVRLNMVLDSGAELNLIDRRVNRKVMDRFTIIKRVNLVGVGRREVEVLAGTLRDIKCGNQFDNKMNTLLTSMDEFNNVFGVNVHGVLGYEFLKNRRVLINYKREKLYFFNPVKP